ncbi:MAG: hypothetical protein FJW40_10265 [Acidobacteria bacterium]|nr:hypothetical protein [Acidobacteriota bacterium]
MPVIVNGERIEDAAILEEQRLIRPRLQEAMENEPPEVIDARVTQWARENVIERALLRQAALADPEPVPAEALESALREVRDNTPGQTGCVLPGPEDTVRAEVDLRLRVDRLFERAARHVGKPPSKDIAEYYRKNRAEFQRPETIHAAHIVKNVDANTDEATAREAIGQVEVRLREGADFAELADELSDCPGRGGDLGFFPRGEMVEEFDEAVFPLPVGGTTGIFRSPFGFHIARLLERRPAGALALEEVKDQISATLHQQRREKAIEMYLDRLWKNARIEDVP